MVGSRHSVILWKFKQTTLFIIDCDGKTPGQILWGDELAYKGLIVGLVLHDRNICR